MPDQPNIINNKIHDYLEGRLSSEEVDDLWAEMLGDEQGFQYMETLSLLKKMGSEGQFADSGETESRTDDDSKTRDKTIVYYLRFAAAVAATILLTVMAVQQTDFLGNQSTSAPITSIDYGIERSGEVADYIESVKSHIIELADLGKTDDAVLFLNEQLSNERLTDIQMNELRNLKGSLYYNSERYHDAKLVFQEGMVQIDRQADSANFEKNLWYFANTLLQLGEKEQAIEYLNRVIQLDGSFGRAAQNLLAGVIE